MPPTTLEETGYRQVLDLLADNKKVVERLYALATAFLVGTLVVHLYFASHFVDRQHQASTEQVMLFATFNLAAILVEIFLSRIAFMLGSRAGQLRDMVHALAIARSGVDIRRFDGAMSTIMRSRRDERMMKILHIEDLIGRLKGQDGKVEGSSKS